jgi:hypothetical protein
MKKEEMIEALRVGHACILAVERRSGGNRATAGRDGPYAADVLAQMIDELLSSEEDNQTSNGMPRAE